MATTPPYTYIQCPCTSDLSGQLRKGGESTRPLGEGEAEDERDFDPRAPRSSYSLYPLEHLLYCEDCQQIRCPRCVLDEIVTWFCPNCLFEVPSSTVKSEGNRCTRSCFQCPICVAPLSVNSLEASRTGGLLGVEQASQPGPYILSCSYCSWSSKDIGIKFEKPNSIYAQLSRVRNGGKATVPMKERRELEEPRRNNPTSIILEEDEDEARPKADDGLDIEIRFSKLKSFYQSQLAETSTASSLSFSGDYSYGSPSTLSRIMGLYTGGSYADKKSKSKTSLMREAYDASEGFQLSSTKDTAIEQLQKNGWAGTLSTEQRIHQLRDSRFVSDVRPVPYMLRTKRSKRCKTCRHILSKPEAKVQSTRFRIRLAALSYIPKMTIMPMPTATQPAGNPAPLLTPLKPTQFLLTLKNPLFDPVRVTLATPSHTPGRFSSKITILCPQFVVGAHSDAWVEALQEGVEPDKKRTGKEAADGQGQAEAGKVWDRGRDWVSVPVEVVPASLRVGRGLAVLKSGGDVGEEENEIAEDEDVLEIPVFVRVEWETDATHDETGTGHTKEKDVKDKRELAYWCVLGVGRIAQG